MRSLRHVLPGAGLLLLFLLMVGVCSWNWRQTFLRGEIYFLDADCYSRMTRVQQVLAHPWQAIRHHAFENAPFGTTPHTTAAMDFAIAGLATVLKPFTKQNLDMAGAFISPLLGGLLVVLLGWRAWATRQPYAWAAVVLILFSPIIAHGFLIGRPDHQSLIILLVGAAWVAELALWQTRKDSWRLAGAALWALAAWTSLFEPLILLVATLLGRLFVLGPRDFLRGKEALVFGGLLGGAYLFEGWRFQPFSKEESAEFFRWAQNIGELRHPTFGQLCRWTGWLLPIAPLLLIYRYLRTRERINLALAALTLLLIGLSLWYMRWGYFLALGFALSLPWALRAIPVRWVGWSVFLLSLGALLPEWDGQLFPDEAQSAAREEMREDAVLLRETARALVSPTPGILLAPWWLSPPLVYWSGQYCVAGSSHQSLPGIVDTARFYLTTSAPAARDILKNRRVSYVIAYEPSRTVSNAAQILGTRAPAGALGSILYDRPFQAPDYLRLVYENQFFKVYEFTGL